MKTVFDEYISNYDINNKKLKQKYTHTLRVQKLCEEIAKSLNLSEEDIKLAGMCGLFHDIGRFEQLSKFDSYNDFKTIDHGDVGYKKFIERLAPNLDVRNENKNIIAKSILYHNKFVIGNVTDRERIFINIIRDADKIDILYLYLNDEDYLLKDYDGQISNSVRKDFFKRRLVNRKNVTNKREHNIATLAFIWGINYDCSYRIIKENKYFVQLEKALNNSIYDEYFQIIKDFLKEK